MRVIYEGPAIGAYSPEGFVEVMKGVNGTTMAPHLFHMDKKDFPWGQWFNFASKEVIMYYAGPNPDDNGAIHVKITTTETKREDLARLIRNEAEQTITESVEQNLN